MCGVKVIKFGSIAMEGDNLVLKEFGFEVNKDIDINNKPDMDRRALMAVVMFIVEQIAENDVMVGSGTKH